MSKKTPREAVAPQRQGFGVPADRSAAKRKKTVVKQGGVTTTKPNNETDTEA